MFETEFCLFSVSSIASETLYPKLRVKLTETEHDSNLNTFCAEVKNFSFKYSPMNDSFSSRIESGVGAILFTYRLQGPAALQFRSY